MNENNRLEAIATWLQSADRDLLLQLQQSAKSTDLAAIADWIGQNQWMPQKYDPKFPYPTIYLGANYPESFKELSVALPPMLLDLAGAKVESRFISLCYLGSKATWSDGRSSATFPFFSVYQPFIDHVAVAIDLLDCDLGSDDCYPTHALLCDRLSSQVFAGRYEEVQKFIEQQHPPAIPLKPEDLEAIERVLAQMPPLNLEDFQQLGMFEIFSRPSPEQIAATVELIEWLDLQINAKTLEKYKEAIQSGNRRAIWHWEDFQARVRATNDCN